MSHHRRDPNEEAEAVPAHVRVRRASVKRSQDAVEIVMPSTIDDAVLRFVSKPAAARTKNEAKQALTEPAEPTPL